MLTTGARVIVNAGRLHDVVLCQATVVGLHSVTTAGLDVSDVAEPQLATAVLVALKLGNGSIGSVGGIETDDTSASGAATRFILNLRLLYISNGAKELDQVLIACRPWKLEHMLAGLDKVAS